jgi:hypothetical protein
MRQASAHCPSQLAWRIGHASFRRDSRLAYAIWLRILLWQAAALLLTIALSFTRQVSST